MEFRKLLAYHAYHQVFQFDDIPTVSGMARIPKDYNHLVFSSYNVISPRDPALSDLISDNDLNCAVSPPNALIGSRYDSDHPAKSSGAYFKICNGTSMIEQGLYPYFSLLDLSIKPMDAPPPGTTITIKGYRFADKEPLVWHVDFVSGYHLPLFVKMHEFSRVPWDRLYSVEILADFGEDALDWEFCMDDLEVQFFQIAEKDSVDIPQTQAVFRDGSDR